MQIAFIVFLFIMRPATIESLNAGGLNTLISIFLIAPLFVIPLFCNLLTSVVYFLIALISHQWWLFVIEIIVLGISVYFCIDFFTKVQLK